MAVEITHVRLSAGGSTHERITDYKWRSSETDDVNSSSKPAMVDWIENESGKAYVGSGANRASVGAVKAADGQPYLRTHADGQWTNNLLSLPGF